MSVLVRERPPTRLAVIGTAPTGRRFRWAEDEWAAENVLGSGTITNAMPGGFGTFDGELARKPGVDYSDLVQLSRLDVLGAGGRVAGEYRLEGAPVVSGDRMAVSPSAVGHQAELEDDQYVRVLYVDIDLNHWGPQSVARRLQWLAGNHHTGGDGSVVPDVTSGEPAVQLEAVAPWKDGGRPAVEAWYDAKGLDIESIYYAWKKNPAVSAGWIDPADVDWAWSVFLSTDDVATSFDGAGNLRAAGPSSGTLTATVPGRTMAGLQLRHLNELDIAFAGFTFDIWFTLAAVYGRTGVAKRGVATLTDAPGVYDSDIARHAVSTFTNLRVTDESVQATNFIVPQAAYVDPPTTVGGIVRDAARFQLPDWAVWERKTFWWYPRGTKGRRWRLRIGPAELESTGPQVSRLWESIVVQYQDGAGTTRTVGPPGSGADVESGRLKDTDPLNPANLSNTRRRDVLEMGTAKAEVAIEVGARFLELSKLLDSSGRAKAVGWVQDDRGILHPAWAIRGGDLANFVDASDRSYRRIIQVSYDIPTRTASFDLDAPPEGLQALLEQLNVALVPLGLGG